MAERKDLGTCSGCDVRISGYKTCHCPRCHRTFSVVRLFDRHQSRGKCLDPARMKRPDGSPVMVISESRGIWVGATEPDYIEPRTKKGK